MLYNFTKFGKICFKICFSIIDNKSTSKFISD